MTGLGVPGNAVAGMIRLAVALAPAAILILLLSEQQPGS